MGVLVISFLLLLQAPAKITKLPGGRELRPPSSSPSSEQIEAIRETLRNDKQVQGCPDFGEPLNDFLRKLRFSRITLSPGVETVLAEAGPGCMRGGQGSNGAMWIARFDHGKVTILASPDDDFEGWLYSVQPRPGGYSDIVLGWHNNAAEAGLLYFRFNGTRYHSFKQALLRRDAEGHETITPVK